MAPSDACRPQPKTLAEASVFCYPFNMETNGLAKDIQTIKERNSRVEADKAWEVSFVRRLFIAIGTYIIAAVWLVLINDFNPWLKALVPTVGYLLSTLSLPLVKKWWINKIFNK